MANAPGQSKGFFDNIGDFLSGGGSAPDLNSGDYFKNTGLDSQNQYVQSMMSNPNQGSTDQYETGSNTGTQAATDAVNNNSILSGGLQGMQGQLQAGQNLQAGQTGQLNQLQSQGFQLTPGDNTMYGQAAANATRQFGQQGNAAAANLRSRGLGNSGAAGATFSGLQGNQNEMLAQAQQQIMQQRYQNTMQQIGQTQSFLSSLNGQNDQAAGNIASQGASDINSQYQRQLSGAQNTAQNVSNNAAQNTNENNSKLNQYQVLQGNTPASLGDFVNSGIGAFGQSIGQSGANFNNSFGSSAGKSAGSMMSMGA